MIAEFDREAENQRCNRKPKEVGQAANSFWRAMAIEMGRGVKMKSSIIQGTLM